MGSSLGYFDLGCFDCATSSKSSEWSETRDRPAWGLAPAKGARQINFFTNVTDGNLTKQNTGFPCFVRTQLGLFCVSVDRRLGRGQPRDWHAEGRAGNVIQPRVVTELDRSRVSAMFAANAELEFFARGTAARGSDANEFAHAFHIDRNKRIAGDQAFGKIVAEKGAGIVPGAE